VIISQKDARRIHDRIKPPEKSASSGPNGPYQFAAILRNIPSEIDTSLAPPLKTWAAVNRFSCPALIKPNS
jgi:hypothetical protein